MNDILLTVYRIICPAFVVVTMLRTGLSLTIPQIIEPLRNIRLVGLSLVTNFVLVPLFAYLLLQIVPLSEPLKDGLVIMALAAGPPVLPKFAEIVKGNLAFSAGLMILLMLGTIISMPIVLPLILPGVEVNSWEIAKPLVVLMLTPLVIGLLIKSRHDAIAALLVPITLKASSVGLIFSLVVGITLQFHTLIELFRTGTILICIVFLLFSLFIGYLLGGPNSDTRRVLAVGTGQRNIAGSLLIGTTNFADPNVLSIIVVTNLLMVFTITIFGRKLAELAEARVIEVKQAEA